MFQQQGRQAVLPDLSYARELLGSTYSGFVKMHQTFAQFGGFMGGKCFIFHQTAKKGFTFESVSGWVGHSMLQDTIGGEKRKLTADLPTSKLASMSKLLLIVMVVFMVAGCASQPQWHQQPQDLFAPAAMRIHPVFTRIRHWSGTGRIDGIEVMVEFQDRFGDPAKAAGNFIFEIYEYRYDHPNPRGNRIGMPFTANVSTVAAQRDRWNRTTRCYAFQLVIPDLGMGNTYVLLATFDSAADGRFTDSIVLVNK